MKKSVLLFLVFSLIISNPGNAQGLLKKVTKSMTNELLGKPQESSNNKNSNQPEPACACDKPELVMEMGGNLQLDYSEVTISVSDDGRILAKQRYTNDYYIVQSGATVGPLKPGDKRLKGFEDFVEPDRDNVPDNSTGEESGEKNPWIKYEYITRSGEKYLITFGGKTYGPYGAINGFAVSQTKEKFAAIVVENTPYSKMDAKKMEAAMKNAKTDQEKMDLSMQYAQQMQQNMMDGGGPAAMQPKFISNIPDVVYDPIKTINGTLKGNLKYDDIFLVAYDKIMDLKGNTIMPIVPEAFGSERLFLNTNNTKYAYYNYGTLTFNDKTTLSELFGLRMIKADGQVFLAYMYYSPKRNAIMQCKIPF
jgi:hypothetical protein